ncbi:MULTISPECIES: MBG domain-containing protein [unclassified Lysobacter]|nr:MULTISPECIES: MBG domain-containing protein [unclassified Lysobacter]MBT2744847.1 filamentous hemagglutinin N-terminal domain-containing protein [Lysobacter sp. ISL-42]MBT2752160.1 filamentous hemagglutinin N-terminal domain-containing protein [Lysobacter sp. ISL-50]MBT2778657.1 filamentous hemagglutinin N-terminal domain-containing protein [Lysobacter sp. ISL-54]MBT2780412.1 filamentous hemagglutinin N-terminal domain-containing protein [Lysobacter sp. ISL-52]
MGAQANVRSIHRTPRPLVRHALPLALAASLATSLAQAQPPLPTTLPINGTVIGGNAVIALPGGNTMTITQASNGAIIDWGGFSIGSAATVNVSQPSATSVLLNRVVGDGSVVPVSQIFGSLNANGRVFLVNPSGVVFGAGSQVNVGSLVASTLSISNADFQAGVDSGRFVFTGNGEGVTNDGTITATSGGTVALLSSDSVDNTGQISAPRGTVIGAKGSGLTLDFQGDGLTQVTIDDGGSVLAFDINNSGTLTADGGQVVLTIQSNDITSGIVNTGTIRARTLDNRGGRVVLSAGTRRVEIDGGQIDVSGADPGQSGGTISVTGSDVGVLNGARLDASGQAGGGRMDLGSSDGTLVVDAGSVLSANAIDNGDGGYIGLQGGNGGARIFGDLSSHGGANGGFGGQVVTGSSAGFDLRGVRVSTGGGFWSVGAQNVSIVNGAATGAMPTDPYEAVTATVLQDGDINRGLDAGSSLNVVALGTASLRGDLNVDGSAGAVAINRSVGSAPLTVMLSAKNQVAGNNFSIGSSNGPLNIDVISNAVFAAEINGGISFANATLLSNGGAIRMYGQNDAVNGFATAVGGFALQLFGTTLDTRIGQNDANGGGNVLVRARGLGASAGEFVGEGLLLSGTQIHASTGDISLLGVGDIGSYGVQLDGRGTNAGMSTTSGAIDIVGINGGGAFPNESGLGVLGGFAIQSGSGRIRLSGHSGANGGPNADQVSDALVIEDGVIAGGGGIELNGSSDGSGVGVSIGAASRIDGGAGTVLLRAGNNGVVSPMQLAGTVTAGAVNVRAGEVTAAGEVLDRNAAALRIGGGAGEFVSAASLANIAAPNLVIGHADHAGAITIAQALTRGGNLSLQNTGGNGGIALNGAVNLGSGTLALVSGGNISQSAAGGITAQSLLARSNNGSVDLSAGQNDVSGNTLAGGAAGNFNYTDINALSIGNVAAVGFDAAGAVSALSESGIGASGAVSVRNNAGDLTLNQDVSGTDVDLVTAGRLQNAAGSGINASNRWRVWANTWVGETRGGLAGSGALPNLYNCSFGGTCGVTVPTAGDHFIYAAQPTATIDVASFVREYGLNNPALSFSFAGLILGDTFGNAITGDAATLATILSDVGNYAIGGNFTSPAGYALQINPGTASITPASLVFSANPYSRLYGDPNGTLGGTVSGFRNGQSVADLLGTPVWTTNATQGSDVGRYAIGLSGVSSQNYNFVAAPGNASAFEIQQAPLLFTANPFSRRYGDPNGALSGTVSGFRNGQGVADLAGSLAWSSDATQASDVGQYAVHFGGVSSQNYQFVEAGGNATALEIRKAPLVFTADPFIRLYGDPNGALSGTVSGFRNGQSAADLAGSLAWSSDATQASGVGRYAIGFGGVSSRNYEFVAAGSNATALEIQKATLTYVADPLAVLFGQKLGDFTGSVAGFRNGDTQGTATTGVLKFSAEVGADAVPGVYPIQGSGLEAQNYAFAQAPANLTALSLNSLPPPTLPDMTRLPPDSYVYSSNVGKTPTCPSTGPLDTPGLARGGDTLAREWSKVRSRPNLNSCLASERKSGCGDF